ncbi:hypothetical protein MTO96_019843 [Rhipicephalus appendiculatus]
MSPIHKCDPATAERGSFCLLRFRPRPVRSSLDDLATPGSPWGRHVDAQLSADTGSTRVDTGKDSQPQAVWVYRQGNLMSPIHKCDPATAERGSFCLLRFRPRPVRSSLGDLATPGSPWGRHVDAQLSADTGSTRVDTGKDSPPQAVL